jgi:hypothetical protein
MKGVYLNREGAARAISWVLLGAAAAGLLYSAAVLVISMTQFHGWFGVRPAQDGNSVIDPVRFCANAVVPALLPLLALAFFRPFRHQGTKNPHLVLCGAFVFVVGTYMAYVEWLVHVGLEGHFGARQLVWWL